MTSEPAVTGGRRPASDAAGDGARVEPPATTGDAGFWLLTAAGGFLVGTVCGAVLLAVVAAALGRSGSLTRLMAAASPPAWVVVCELVGVWTGFVGAVALASRVRGSGRPWADMGLRFRWIDAPIGIVVGVVGQTALLPVLYWPLAHIVHVHDLDQRLSQPAQRLTGGFAGGDLAVIAVLTVVVVPVVEELFFRGLVLRALLRLGGRLGAVVGPIVAVVLTGVIFGLAHWEPLQLLGLAGFGVVLSALAARTRRLGGSIVAHASFNLVAVIAVAWPHNGVF